jgi:hypothetical protein
MVNKSWTAIVLEPELFMLARCLLMKILLFCGTTLVSKLIRWQSRGPYSHAAMLFEGVLYEAREGVGVHRIIIQSSAEVKLKMPKGYGQYDTFRIDYPALNTESILSFLMDQLGKKYDYGSVLRFISRRQANRRDSGKWFCSEMCVAAVQQGGLNLLERIEPWAVSPAMLAYSPFLKQVQQ